MQLLRSVDMAKAYARYWPAAGPKKAYTILPSFQTLPAGPQIIGLENESVGFRDVRTVEVIPGKITPVAVTLPNGEISINARPWAEVFVDGNRVGETPVSQLSLPLGVHEVVFRHPDLGERRVSVVVKIGATGRAFTDFTK